MFTFDFGRKVRRVARRQRRRGNLDQNTYQRIATDSLDTEIVAKWQAAIESNRSDSPWMQKANKGSQETLTLTGDWFIEKWPVLLQIIIPLLTPAEPAPQQKRKRGIKRLRSRLRKQREATASIWGSTPPVTHQKGD